MVVPLRLRLELDPVADRLQGQTDERTPDGRDDQILKGRPLEERFDAELVHRGSQRRVDERVEFTEAALAGADVVCGAEVRVPDVVDAGRVVVPVRTLDVVPPFREDVVLGLRWS